MKISSINAYGQRNIYQQRKAVQHPSITVPEAPKQSVSFQGKHSFAKGFAGIAGLLGTAGAVGGILIMTGGLGAASAGAGAVVGHQLDKTEDKDKDK
ncbi:TPA: hypothetical protein CPT89_08785 [Candidatus Gastranaerophilales bacterium HUM_11]|nr:MAG TPA: hypothetical protein CPT89_08785 [Candidatus Gastranaerophilales bacterium HUM_11]